MSFTFINHSEISRAERKLIRSQAAKGKNLGKPRPRVKKQRTVNETNENSKENSMKSANCSASAVPYSQRNRIERPICNGLSVISLPIDLSTCPKHIFERAFSIFSRTPRPMELDLAIDYTGLASIWTHFMFIDEAYFHCSVATSTLVAPIIWNGMPDSVTEIQHIRHSLRLVNDSVRRNDKLSHVTIATVLALSNYERMRGQYANGLIHLQGLRRMIELQGGISELKAQYPVIALKIFRADLEFALHCDSRTWYDTSTLGGRDTLQWLHEKTNSPHGRNQRRDNPIWLGTSEAFEIFADAMSFSDFFNHGMAQVFKLNGYAFQSVVILLGYRVVNLCHTRKSWNLAGMDDVHNIGLAAFVTSFLMTVGQTRPKFKHLCDALRHMEQFSIMQSREHWETLLWAMLIGGATTLNESDEYWLLPKIANAVHELELQTWEEALDILCSFPFVRTLHTEPSRALWYKSLPFLPSK